MKFLNLMIFISATFCAVILQQCKKTMKKNFAISLIFRIFAFPTVMCIYYGKR